ncbi:hypothetical protein ACSBL2_16430 [Pedobacter sp. AW31-3R]|uniref:hypothetical protein n=1 Tax=Pedobacter sp. AW31-3R TaxID=3445781 RepID=UPI003F9EDCE4
MIFGIISEGHSDRAVITNILSGVTGLSDESIIALLPQYKYDATDVAGGRGEIHGGWNAVKDECNKRVFIDDFLMQDVDDENFLVIHFDTAESAQYPIAQINKDANYCSTMREQMIILIKGWLNEDLTDKILHAIAIEETEAWILSLNKIKDSWKSANPKKKLEHVLKYKTNKLKPSYDLYKTISLDIKQSHEVLKSKQFIIGDPSLNAFLDEIAEKVMPKLID